MSLPDTTLQAIRNKVRRITKSPSPQQITDSQIDEYVNTYYQIDFPEELRLKSLFTNYVFYTEVNVPEYEFPTGSTGVNGVDGFVSVEPPLYIDGYQSFYTQSQSEFYTLYPKLAITEQLGIGDGGTLGFTFTSTNAPFLPTEVVICSEDVNGESIEAHAQPQSPVTLEFIWDLAGDVTAPSTINYVTGAISINFSTPPAAGQAINLQCVPYFSQRPLACLFYDNKFILRPVPDGCYKVEIAAYKTPTQLLAANQSPEIQQWWQLLSLGACLKIFEDRGDLQSRATYFPVYDEYLRQALRRTLVQQTNERVGTIYTEQTSFPYGQYFNRF